MTEAIKHLDWLGGWDDVEIETASYADGSLAVKLVTDGELLTVASVNLSAYAVEPLPGAFWVKDYSEHAGLGDALVAVGVALPTGRSVEFGPFDAAATEYLLVT